MARSFIDLVVGDLGEKRAYRQLMKRVNALPKDYRFAFKKIQQYLYNLGCADCNMAMFTDLADLFEASAAEGKQVLDVLGADVSGFCDELIHASGAKTAPSREKLNKEILEHFHREGA